MPEGAKGKLQILGEGAEQSICGHGQVNLERAAFSDDARVVLYAEDELAIDHFAVYQIPIPELFQSQPGRRTIRISLAYDPPVRHSRRDYTGVTMGFRLIRGCEPDLIFEHYRRRTAEEESFPKIASRLDCTLEPSSTRREKSTLQSATATFKRNISQYGDSYYLVVRCAEGWATEIFNQNFAIVVEIAHESEIQLYERLRQRVRL